jgi:hypothetical protein
VPINRLRRDGKLAPEEAERLNRALKLVLGALHLVDCNDPLTDLIAKKLVEVGATGVRSVFATAHDDRQTRAPSRLPLSAG